MIDRLKRSLQEFKDKGNYRTIKYLKPLSDTKVLYRSKEYLNLCSNSYLSLHTHPLLLKAAKDALDEYGSDPCSSRSVSGSIALYETLEQEIAKFKNYKRGLIFSNGYLANIGIISTLTGDDDLIFSDELNHSSLIDSIRLSRAKRVIYKHRNMKDLEKKIKNTKTGGKRFIVTESIFSMDGDCAPLNDLFNLKKRYGIHIILDDAHGTGVFGRQGKGVEEVFNLSGKMDVHMGTFGKALGSYGAFVLSDNVVIDFLINRARTFMYTTALPASSLAASLAALRVIKKDSSLKQTLWKNIDYIRIHLKKAGFDLKESMGPIIPIVVGNDKKAVMMQKLLMKKGLFLQAIRPPTVPEDTSRLRLTVVKGFTKADMDHAIESIIDAGRKMRLI
jgi:8-amino-7-oxononanoate synthase